MTASAQFDTLTSEPIQSAPPPLPDLPSALRLQVAERVEAHRRRKRDATRPLTAQIPAPLAASKPPSPTRRANLAATVAERYAQTPSYRAFLAEQAQRAIQEAAAAADVAVRSAQAVAEAQQNLLSELELWNAPQQFTAASAHILSADSPAPTRVETASQPNAAMRVRVPMPATSAIPTHARPAAHVTVREHKESAGHTHFDFREAQALDDEIAFRQSPFFDDFAADPAAYTEPSVPLPANLLEFPRQLIAARKARPRLAEGPLLEEFTPRAPQLRIFEVETEHFAAQPSAAPEVAPVQSFLYLDSDPAREVERALSGRSATLRSHASAPHTAPQTAAISRRLFALAVDLLLVAAGVSAAGATALKIAGALPSGPNAAISAAAALVAFWIVYQLLFFTLADQTPGMRCARIGLCTLSDENPSRPAMRRRVLAQWIAILPFGMGMLWALLDDDRLGWHDRISQMYQRAY